MNNPDVKPNALRLVLQISIPLIVLAVGVSVGLYLKSRKPEFKRKPVVPQATPVEVVKIEPKKWTSTIHAMGTVVPDRKAALKAQVSGEVTGVAKAFVTGGMVKKGAVLLTIDSSDYQIEFEKAQSDLDKAVSDLAIEQGSQQIAKEELKLINEVTSENVEATDLALRKPQLLQAQAAVKTARANLDKARLNLARTKIRAPFNALVLEKNVEQGEVVTTSQALGTLVSIDAFQVQAHVPPDRLWAFEAGEKNGSRATIHSRYSQQSWDAKVIRTTGTIGESTRMAGIILSVPDPLGFMSGDRKKPLLLSDHVDIRIMGKEYADVFVLPRNLLREGDTLWIFSNGKLEIRKVAILWKENGYLLVSKGIQASDQIITSNIPAPVNGMAVQIVSGQDK